MTKILLCLLGALIFCPAAAVAQWVEQPSGTDVRLRGVSAVSARVAWASGDRGTYLRTTDGGKTWRAGVVPGAEALDFRDVDAFDERTAYLLAIGEGERSRVYKTTDGGRTWRLQFTNQHPSGFFDCMAFWDRRRGLAVSDPVGGRFLIITTEDGGRTWRESPASGMPPALEGEGAFAASGTCVAVRGERNAWFGTGGPGGARVFRTTDGGRTWKVSMTPLAHGKSAGVFSLAFITPESGVAVGGDYTKEGEATASAAFTRDGGRTWRLADGPPRGYRSGLALFGNTPAAPLIAVGPSGADLTLDGGQNWRQVGYRGFHAVSFAGEDGWAVGEKGLVARYDKSLGKRP
ncbi:MAG TPA: hypothetical protein VEY09_11935 [Pyrinomonadaceae bacterium]|nr:hypothetical protein [Pyrinomonadaceae bacterium]